MSRRLLLALCSTSGYFATMGIAFREGHDFADMDDPSAPLRVIHFSYRDLPADAGEIHVRVRSGPETPAAADIRSIVAAAAPELPLYNVRTLDEHVQANLVFRRIPVQLFAVLGPLLLIIVALGLYAVVSYVVSLRTTELGVRLALGASVRRLVGQLVLESMRAVIVGAALGWTLTFVLATRLAGGRWVDLAAFTAVPLVLLVVAAAACWIPASRVTSVDPVIALREP